MPVLLASAEVISYLRNNMGPNNMGSNNVLLFANILGEDTFIWLCLVYLKNSSGYPEQYTGIKTDMRQTKTTIRGGNECWVGGDYP
jgi:hypothetical protein